MKGLDHRATLFIMLFSMLTILAHAAEFREWTSNKGGKMNAELVSKTDTHLILKKESGKELKLSIEQLSDADQAYLMQLDAAGDAEKPKAVDKAKQRKTTKGRAALLPMLHTGKGEGYFAHYEGDHYVARINRNATMDVYLKDGGKSDELLESWKIVIEPIAYKKNRLGTITGNRMFDIIKHDDPAEDPDRVELSVMLKGDIKCDLIYEFSPESMTTWMRSEHGYDPPEVMNHMMTHRLGSVRNLTEDPDKLEKMRLKIESDKYNYLDKVRINSTISRDDYEISMPAITSTKIYFDKGSDKNTRLMLWKYVDNPLSKGYYIRCRKNDYISTKHSSEKTTITFKGK